MSEKWFDKSGSNYDVAVSTRVRFARNVEGFPFPHKMTNEQKTELINKVRSALCEGNSAISGDIRYIDMTSLSETEILSMVERHLISPDYATQPQGKALLITEDESVSLMLCEEDHIRLQVMKTGLSLEETYDYAEKLCRLLSENLKFSFSEKYGYLTACPTNLGTAMRASVMLHLPALEKTGALARFAEQLSKLGLTIRGVYGEGTKSIASMYQLSNQTTLGISEGDTIAKLSNLCQTLMEAEKKARQTMLERTSILDSIWKAYGTLKYGRLLSGSEFAELYSLVRFGASEGVFDNLTADKLAGLFEHAQAATLCCECGTSMSASERDVRRAELVRNHLS